MLASTARLEVQVFDIQRQLLTDAEVRLEYADPDDGTVIELDFDPATRAYIASELEPGRAVLSASAPGLELDARDLDIGVGAHREMFVLGRQGLPHYYRGRVKVPFEFRELVGVSLKATVTDDELQQLRETALALGLTEADDVTPVAADEGVKLYRLPSGSDDRAIDAILVQLDAETAVQIAGLVLEAKNRYAVFLSRQIVARFKAHISDRVVPGLARNFGLGVVRKLPFSPNAWLLQKDEPAGFNVLEACEGLVQSGDVLYAEPNTVEAFGDLAISPGDWLYPAQWHLPLVKLPDAWETLRAANPVGVSSGDAEDITYGSADIIVGIMDRGIESQTVGGVTTAAHPDFAGSVSNGKSKVAGFFDFQKMVANNDALSNSHGMACAGVALARADNPSLAVPAASEGVVGAAPNCRAFAAIKPVGGTNAQWADAYVWLAGFAPGWLADDVNYPTGTVFPPPNAQPCTIISNAFDWSAPPLAGVLSDTFDYLATYGRGGRGVAIFWASGNFYGACDAAPALHPKVMAVGASTLDDDGVTEVRATYSDYGTAIEFCAPGHDVFIGGTPVHDPPKYYGVITADLVGGGTMPGAPAQLTTLSAAVGPSGGSIDMAVASSAGFAADQGALVGAPGAAGTEAQLVEAIPDATTIRVAGLRNNHPIGANVSGGSPDYMDTFGGTSSATSLAAGIAALCLSVNPDLSWVELRQILRTTAHKIDPFNASAVGKWMDTTGNGVTNFSQWYGWGRLNAHAAVKAAWDYAQNVDLVVRENLGDTGAVPSGGWHAKSPDIWADPNDVPIAVLAALPYTDDPPHVMPIRGQDNYLFIRVKNFGTATSSDFWVRGMITHYPGFEFRYPQEWTPSNLPGQSPPVPLVPGTYLIDEVELAGLAPGEDTIIKMKWESALVPDDTVIVDGSSVKWHPCLLAEVAPHDGPPATGGAYDVKRYNNLAHRNIAIGDPTESDLTVVVVAGTSDEAGVDTAIIDRTLVPADYRVTVRVVDERIMRWWLDLVGTGGVAATEPLPGSEDGGGPGSGDPRTHAPPEVSVPDSGQAMLIFGAGGATAIELPLRLEPGQFVPLVIGLHRASGLVGEARLSATQRRADGELSAGYSIEG